MTPTPEGRAKPVRLPLQTGETALKELFFAQAGVIFLIAGVGSMFKFGFTAIHALIGSLLLAGILRSVRRRRASDSLLGDEALEIEGGPEDHKVWPWDAVKSCRIDVDEKESMSIGGVKEYLHRLILVQKNTIEEVVAESVDPDERRSMQVLAHAIQTKLAQKSGEKEETPAMASDVVVCGGCGAPVPPSDAAETLCPYCHAGVKMPEAIRERVAGGKKLVAERVQVERSITKLFTQPGAKATNQLMTAFAAAWLFIAPVTAIVMMAATSGFAVLPVFTVLLALWSFVRMDVASRVALRALLTGYGAGARGREGRGHTCRSCGAPLPSSDEGGVLVRCAYCEADNVLGIDLLPVTRELAAAELDVESALVARREAVTLRNWKLFAAAVLLLTWAYVTFVGAPKAS